MKVQLKASQRLLEAHRFLTEAEARERYTKELIDLQNQSAEIYRKLELMRGKDSNEV